MESPVRIKLGVIVLLVLTGLIDGYPKDGLLERESDNVSPSEIKASNNVEIVNENSSQKPDIFNTNTNISVPSSTIETPSSTTNKLFFRGSTKFFTTKPPFKPKIPHMRRNFTRSTNIETNGNINAETATTQSNEIEAIHKLKELKLSESLEKLRKTKTSNKNVEGESGQSKQKESEENLFHFNDTSANKPVEQSFNIDKYISDDFHDINNVYSHPISPEIEHYIVPDNESAYEPSINLTPKTTILTTRITPLTTPHSDLFDQRFKEVSESIRQNLADVEIDYSNDEKSTLDDEKFNFSEVLSKPINNDTSLQYKNTAEIILTDKVDKNNKLSNSEKTNETKIVYESSTLAINSYDKDTSVADNQSNNEITTPSNRVPKSSSSDFVDPNTEANVDRRNDFFKRNHTRKEYLSTIRMRSRTTIKPRIRISLKTNRNSSNRTQESNSSEEAPTTYRGAEVVKMQPFIKYRNNLSTSPSKIDPIEVTASDAVERFVSSLSKRGSTKVAENFDKTENGTYDLASSFSIPPTATAWALIKFKDIGKRNVSSNISEQSLSQLDNRIKSESEELNTINADTKSSSTKVKPEMTTNIVASQTMEVDESNLEIVTSSTIALPTAEGQESSQTTSTNSLKRPSTENTIETKTELYLAPPLTTTPYFNSNQNDKKPYLKLDNNKYDNLTTPFFMEDNNTTSTVGTEINTESFTKNIIDNIVADLNPPSKSVENRESQITTTNITPSSSINYMTTETENVLTTTTDSSQEDKSEYIPSTKSFVEEYSTTVSSNVDNIETTEFDKLSKTTQTDLDDLDEFTFTSIMSSTYSPTEASGDIDETTYQAVSENYNINFPSTNYVSTEFDVLTQPTTLISKLTTRASERPTTRLLTSLTTSLLPFSEDILDSREVKNKITSEDEEKNNNEYDWIDMDTSNDKKGSIDSNEIPLPTINKTDSDVAEIDDNNADNEISKGGGNASLIPTTTTTQRTNIEIIEPSHNVITDGERETTTTFGEDLGEFDAVDGSGAIAAITISAIGIVALLLLIGILIVARGRRQGGGYGQRCTPVSLDSYSLDNVSVNGTSRRKARNASKRSYGNPAYDEAGATSHPMQFAALANFALDQESIMNEFNEIPMIYGRTDEIPPGCESKNRFSNVIPLPETRVSLKMIPGDETSDYINANFVRGPKCLKKYYIACQAPMSTTVNDFWRMIWEQNSRVILMLTEYMENGAEKCFEYIPPSEVSDSRRTFGDYQIVIKKRDIRDKYVISQLQLKNLNTKTWREITHMWYFWPAKGVPDECHSIIAFLLEARSYLKATQNAKEFDEDGHDSMITHNGSYANNVSVMENEDEPEMNIYNVQRGEKANNGNSKTGTLTYSDGTKRGGPMVVHCSPGTGRTGAVMACDIGIRDFEMSRSVDVPKTVYRIRRDRANSVQTKDQYVFIYKVLSEYATKLTGGVLDSI